MSERRMPSKKPTRRPPVTEVARDWLFSALIRNQNYLERALPLMREDFFSGYEYWLFLIWHVVIQHYRKYGELPTKNVISSGCNTALELDPSALSDTQISELNEFLKIAFDLNDEDFPERAVMSILQKFLEDRLLYQARSALSRPQIPLAPSNVFSQLAETANAFATLTGGDLFPADFEIICDPPDRYGRCSVTARRGSNSHRHRFDPYDQSQREKFCLAVQDRLNISYVAAMQLNQLVLEAAEKKSLGAANVVSLTGVVAKPVAWLWAGYIPLFGITLLEGDPGLNKSMIALDLAARKSRGDAMPPYQPGTGKHPPGNTLIISGEDDLERTIKPRLAAAGACQERIYFLPSVNTADDERSIQFPTDVQLVEDIVKDKCIVFLIIDVLGSVTEAGTSCNDDAAMRRLLTPLARMAQRTQLAVLVLRHHNKKSGTTAVYRGGGSIGIIGAARSALAVAPHPSDPELRVLASVKSNLGPRPTSLTYSVEPTGDVARIVWGAPIDITADQLLSATGTHVSKLEQAKAILAATLAGEPQTESHVRRACERADIGEKTYRRARRELGVATTRANGYGAEGKWVLSLPGTTKNGSVKRREPTNRRRHTKKRKSR